MAARQRMTAQSGIHLNPKHVNAYYSNRGAAYQKKGGKDKAEVDFEKASNLGYRDDKGR